MCHVDDLRIPLLIESVPQTERRRFIDAVLGGVMGRPDAEELRSTIEAWMASGCNLADCARRCGVHRNTVIYRLEKLHQITDIDLRIPLNAVAAYLAVVGALPAQG